MLGQGEFGVSSSVLVVGGVKCCCVDLYFYSERREPCPGCVEKYLQSLPYRCYNQRYAINMSAVSDF